MQRAHEAEFAKKNIYLHQRILPSDLIIKFLKLFSIDDDLDHSNFKDIIYQENLWRLKKTKTSSSFCIGALLHVIDDIFAVILFKFIAVSSTH